MPDGLSVDPGLSIPTGLSPTGGLSVSTGLHFSGFGGASSVSNGILQEGSSSEFIMMEDGQYILQE